MNVTVRFRLLILACLVVFSLYAEDTARFPNLDWTYDVGARTLPSNNQIYNVKDYGAVANGTTLNTKAIQKAIDDCASHGGGIVTFPQGKFLTGAIYLKEGVHLIVPKGTTLLGSTKLSDYPDIDTRVAGIEMAWPSALINVLEQKNVLLSGGGTIHAQGKIFWDSYWSMRKDYEKKGLRWIVDYDCKRPRTLLVSQSSDFTVKDLTFQQAGFWTIQILYSEYCTVDGVTIQNNVGGHGPSTDGVDIDSSSHILVQNCDIDCNDDNFCLKAGRDADGLRVNRPTEYVVIRNCVSRAGGGLLTCGSETSGGIRYVLADGLKAKGTTVGIRLKSAMNRGGTTEHIYIRNVEMDDVGTVFEATMNWNPAYSYSELPKEYENKKLPVHWEKMLEEVDPKVGTPYFNNVYLSDFNVKNSKTLIKVEGSKESLMEDFVFENINGDVSHIGKVVYAKDWVMSNMNVKAKDRLPLDIENSEKVEYPHSETSSLYPYKLKGLSQDAAIVAASGPGFSFLLPEMAGNLRMGIMVGDESKWLEEFKTKKVKQTTNGLIYTLSDPLLRNGELIVDAVSLNNTNGIVIEVSANKLPESVRLFWSYGGAYGKILGKDDPVIMKPVYCQNNVFSVEWTAFTLYYGESMKLKTINAVMPVSSEIRLSDARKQNSPLSFFGSGKQTDAPALAAALPLVNGQKEYFCIYRQNKDADYNHYMLPALFLKQKGS